MIFYWRTRDPVSGVFCAAGRRNTQRSSRLAAGLRHSARSNRPWSAPRDRGLPEARLYGPARADGTPGHCPGPLTNLPPPGTKGGTLREAPPRRGGEATGRERDGRSFPEARTASRPRLREGAPRVSGAPARPMGIHRLAPKEDAPRDRGLPEIRLHGPARTDGTPGPCPGPLTNMTSPETKGGRGP